MQKRVVGLIPIKLNNQRLPGKNIMDLCGKPLCSYLFDTLKEVKNLDDVYVLCSDEEICKYIPEHIKFIKRPKELDLDSVKSKQILDWFVSQVDADIYALMHCTQPFIKADTIDVSIRKVKEEEFDSAFGARPIKEFAWFKGAPINYSFTNVVRTQELEPIYVEGELFIFEKNVLTTLGRRIGEKPYIHPLTWKESICIDELEDFQMAQMAVQMIKENG